MHLKQVTLNNFRCFENIEVSLHPRLTVIVAENGGGKTSILDGIAIGLAPILRYLSSANQRLSGPGFKDTDFRLVPAASKGDEKWVASDYVRVLLETEDGLSWDQSAVSSKGKGKQPINKVGQAQLAAHLSEVFDSLPTSTPKLLPIFAYYGARRGWIEIPERIRDSKVNYDFPTSALLGALKSLSDFKEMLKWFDLEESAELRASKEEYHESPALSGVREAISNILGKRYTHPGFDHRHKFVIQSDIAPGVLQISQLSQGYQSMLALGMDFARRLALGNPHIEHFGHGAQWEKSVDDYVHQWTPKRDDMALFGPAWAPAIMLVDEIDLHLHPEWQQRVLDDLMRTFPGTQFIVTTHSPQVLTTVKRESIRMLAQDAKGVWTADNPKEQTRGVESATALAGVMHVDPIPPVQEARDLSRYQQMIQLRQHDSEEGQKLRTVLDLHFGPRHPLVLDRDRLIRLEQFKAKLPVKPSKPADKRCTT